MFPSGTEHICWKMGNNWEYKDKFSDSVVDKNGLQWVVWRSLKSFREDYDVSYLQTKLSSSLVAARAKSSVWAIALRASRQSSNSLVVQLWCSFSARLPVKTTIEIKLLSYLLYEMSYENSIKKPLHPVQFVIFSFKMYSTLFYELLVTFFFLEDTYIQFSFFSARLHGITTI